MTGGAKLIISHPIEQLFSKVHCHERIRWARPYVTEFKLIVRQTRIVIITGSVQSTWRNNGEWTFFAARPPLNRTGKQVCLMDFSIGHRRVDSVTANSQ